MSTFVGWSVGWSVGWLVGWLVGQLVGWSVGWLVGLLVGLSVAEDSEHATYGNRPCSFCTLKLSLTTHLKLHLCDRHLLLIQSNAYFLICFLCTLSKKSERNIVIKIDKTLFSL